MPEKDAAAYLQHLRDCCLQLLKCKELRGQGNMPESIVLDAVCRNLEIIGEAAGKVSPEFRAAHPEIPWRQMISARNILIHNYDGIDPEIVWGIVERDIPSLLASVQALLEASSD
ncbi:MAG: HepT-like ribonuclease domain-containing protein [Bryobacteraceae bacterium]